MHYHIAKHNSDSYLIGQFCYKWHFGKWNFKLYVIVYSRKFVMLNVLQCFFHHFRCHATFDPLISRVSGSCLHKRRTLQIFLLPSNPRDCTSSSPSEASTIRLVGSGSCLQTDLIGHPWLYISVSARIGDLLFVLFLGLWPWAVLDCFVVRVDYISARDDGRKRPLFCWCDSSLRCWIVSNFSILFLIDWAHMCVGITAQFDRWCYSDEHSLQNGARSTESNYPADHGSNESVRRRCTFFAHCSNFLSASEAWLTCKCVAWRSVVLNCPMAVIGLTIIRLVLIVQMRVGLLHWVCSYLQVFQQRGVICPLLQRVSLMDTAVRRILWPIDGGSSSMKIPLRTYLSCPCGHLSVFSQSSLESSRGHMFDCMNKRAILLSVSVITSIVVYICKRWFPTWQYHVGTPSVTL